MTTKNFSFANAADIFFLFGTAASGLKPWQMKPFIRPWCMRSKIESTS
jgi:hypothetical protein